MNEPTPRLSIAHPWIADQGDGTYRNPILCADYSDPDAIRVGDDFWMTASSFNCIPGLPILHSRDLVNWTLANHALRALPHERYARVQPGCGVWAPAIRHHGGKFWIFFPMPDEGIYVTTATDPRGDWSEPHLLQAGKGLIDPCPLWDDDGKAYLAFAYARSRAGIKDRLRVSPMAPDASKLLGDGQIVFHDAERHPTLEGPKFHRRNGYYYLSAPAGGVGTGWQLILRSKHVYGPYEEKIVLAQGGTPTNGPHQGAIVDTPAGEWWFLHFQEIDPYGRIVHLQPIEWVDDWPLMGINRTADGLGEPVLRHRKPALPTQPIAVPATSDEFDATPLGLQWQWHANVGGTWASLAARPGHLRLFAQPGGGESINHTPHLLLQKFPATRFAAETSVEVCGTGVSAGLVIAGRQSVALLVERTAAAASLVWRDDAGTRTIASLRSAAAELRVEVADGGGCRFASREPGDAGWRPIDPTFTAVEGQWIGAKLGVVCLGEPSPTRYADVDHFRLLPPG